MNADTLWLLSATLLVLSMQIGFLLLEGGRVRAKNSVNVAQKNLTDLVVTWVCFFVFGFTVMFGASVPQAGESWPSPLHFLFHLGFCATATSIISGGVAERIRFPVYLALAAVMASIIYPIVGRLVWGDYFNGEVKAYLGELGFVDFAGATVVHSSGAWAALVAIVMLGPRVDRFDAEGNPRRMTAHSSILSLQGALILTLGWLGFNAGSLSIADPLLQQVLLNTVTTAAFGACSGMLLGYYLDKGVFNPSRVITGLLGGLVMGTASIHVLSHHEAMLCGILGGLIAILGSEFLLHRLKLDDPVDVVSTHGFCGAAGTLMYAFVAPSSKLLNGSRLEQFGVQLLGVGAVALIVVSITWFAMSLLARRGLRVAPEAEKLGLNFTEHGETVDADRLRQALQRQINSGSIADHGVTFDSSDEQGELAQTINQLISRHEEARHQIELSEEKFRQYAMTASDWLWECDISLNLISLNICDDSVQYFLQDIWQGRHLTELFTLDPTDNRFMLHAVRFGQPFGPLDARMAGSGEESAEEDSSATVYAEIRGTPVFDGDDQLIGYRGTIADVTSRKLAENRAVYLALHDELTGLKNRRALDEYFTHVFHESDSELSTIGVLALDLDGFKAVNDGYGHAVGDSVLCSVARRVQKILPSKTHCYRTGGDELVIVLPNLDANDHLGVVSLLSESLINEISRPYEQNDTELHIGVSIGVAFFPKDAVSSDELLRKADLALYDAKTHGKNRLSVFDASMDAALENRLLFENELKAAIDNNDVYVMYQPLYSTETESVVALEALIRWHDPEKGELSPSDFLSKAEKHGQMKMLGELMLDRACEFASTWGDSCSAAVSVNISPSHFQSNGFIDAVVATIERHKIPGHRLELELTEDLLMENHNTVIERIQELEALGVTISIDDFGSGQTSLQYLAQFPVKTLKIDQSFVKNLGIDKRATEITRSMIDMGLKLGYQVVAEGVEKAEQLALLRAWRCPIVQGFYFSQPMSRDNAYQLVSGASVSNTRQAG